jgi:hypothetical protein
MSKKAELMAALKEERIKNVEAAIAKVESALAEGKVTVTNPKTRAQIVKNMTNAQRTKKLDQKSKLEAKLAEMKGLTPKAARARSVKATQMTSNLESGTLYCYKATPEGKRGSELDGALIGDAYLSAEELKVRWGKKTAVKPTGTRASSRATSRAASPAKGGPGMEGGARRRRTVRRRRSASRKASRKVSRKTSRSARRKSLRRSRRH